VTATPGWARTDSRDDRQETFAIVTSLADSGLQRTPECLNDGAVE